MALESNCTGLLPAHKPREKYSTQMPCAEGCLDSYANDTDRCKNDPRLSPEVFASSPDFGLFGYRIDDLASFAVLGLDVKITPRGKVQIIEVNGILSGMKGFEKAGAQYEEFSPLERLMSTSISHLDSERFWRIVESELDGGNSCEAALEFHIASLGREPVAYIAARLAKAGLEPYRLDGTLLSQCSQVHYGWELRYGHLADTLVGIEKLLNDKLQCDRFFSECREIKTRTWKYTEENFQKLLRTELPRFVVIKPSDGKRGEGLTIVAANALPQHRPDPACGLVAESFVPSKPIVSSRNGQSYDGCMRYVLFVEEDKSGEIKLHHFGGYWRLCPSPMSEFPHLDEMRANLAQGALAEKASLDDIETVKAAIERHIPTFYRNLVQKANNEILRNEIEKLGERLI